MNKDDCENRFHCKNTERCLMCDGSSQYIEIKYKNYNDFSKYNNPSKRKKGMKFEEKCRVEYNRYMAERTPLSGGIDGLRGDIITPNTLQECKSFEVVTGGKKQFTIKKEQLEKIEEEANEESKLPFLAAGFKNTDQYEKYNLDEMYFVGKYQYLLELLHRLKHLEEMKLSLTEENKLLKEELDARHT